MLVRDKSDLKGQVRGKSDLKWQVRDKSYLKGQVRDKSNLKGLPAYISSDSLYILLLKLFIFFYLKKMSLFCKLKFCLSHISHISHISLRPNGF